MQFSVRGQWSVGAAPFLICIRMLKGLVRAGPFCRSGQLRTLSILRDSDWRLFFFLVRVHRSIQSAANFRYRTNYYSILLFKNNQKTFLIFSQSFCTDKSLYRYFWKEVTLNNQMTCLLTWKEVVTVWPLWVSWVTLRAKWSSVDKYWVLFWGWHQEFKTDVNSRSYNAAL